MDEIEWKNEEYRLAVRSTCPEHKKSEKVTLFSPFRKKTAVFAFFLLICAVVAAVYAASEIGKNGFGNGWFREGQPAVTEDAGESEPQKKEPEESSEEQTRQPTEESETEPETEESASVAGVENRSVQTVDETERSADFPLNVKKGGTVLVIHTHSSEAYGASVGYFSSDAALNVTSVGKTLTERLNEKGIASVHCEAMHDGPTMLGSYDRAADSIRFFQEQYPDLDLVLDLHRSAEEEATGCVRLTVGTVGSSEEEIDGNLSLAVSLCRALESAGVSVMPIRVVGADLNQSLSPYGLTFEIGSVFDSPQTAQRLAQKVGDALKSVLSDSASAS